MIKRKNLLGKRFGRLVVVDDLGKDNNNQWYWKCLCDCGETTTATTTYLNRSKDPKRSCGCGCVENRFKVGENIGEDNNRWSGGKYIGTHGYVWVVNKEHPMATVRGTVREHRLVMAEAIGRCLLPEESVHHINEIKNDNRIENLMLFRTESEHQKYHQALKRQE